MTRDVPEPAAGGITRAGFWAVQIPLALISALVFWAVAAATQRHFMMPGAVTVLWWPVAALAIAALVRLPRRWWIAVLAGLAAAILYSRRESGLWTVALIFALVNVAEALVGSLLLVGRGRGTIRRLRTRKEALHFVLALGAALAAGAVFIGVRALVANLEETWAQAVTAYLATHIIGLAVFAPLLLPAATRARRTVWHDVEFAGVLIATGAIGAWSFLADATPGRSFALLLPVVWAGARVGPVRTAVVTATAAAIAAYATARGLGPFADVGDLRARSLQAQVFFMALAGSALLLVLITRHREALAERAKAGETTLRRAIHDSLVPMYSIQLDAEHFGEIRDANRAVSTMLGYRSEDLEGQYCGMLGARDYPDRLAALDDYLTKLRDGTITSFREESQFVKADGGLLWVETSVSRVDPVHGPPFALAFVHDLTKRQANEQMLEELALSDPLTGLANRTLLFDRLAEQFAESSESRVGLLYLDLDGFKAINDTYGHAAGDEVLIEVARRLHRAVRPGDTVARLGGDEFAVLCAALKSGEDLEHISDRVRHDLAADISLPSGQTVRIGVSIGSAIDDGSRDADTLMRVADAGMYAEKRIARGSYAGRADPRHARGLMWSDRP